MIVKDEALFEHIHQSQMNIAILQDHEMMYIIAIRRSRVETLM